MATSTTLLPAPLAPRQWTLAEFSRVLGNVPAAAYVCDRDGLITYFNRRAVDVWGREPMLNDSRDRYCGSSRIFWRDGTPMAHEHCWMARALREDREFNGCELVIEQPGGRRIVALAHANPVHGEDGQLLGAVNIIVDISDRKRGEIKDDFLAVLGHELRNPLGPVRNALHILKSRGGHDAQSAWALDLIESQLRELVTLIDNVSEVSRLSSGHIALERSRLDTGDLVSGAIKATADYVARKDQRVTVNVAAADTLVEGDPAMLERAVTAVLLRVSKLTRSGSTLYVRAFATDGAWKFYAGSLPDPQQASPSRTDDPGMDGSIERAPDASVGLALARGIVLAHGGSCQVLDPADCILLSVPIAGLNSPAGSR